MLIEIPNIAEYGRAIKEIRTGIYQVSHFYSSHFLREFEHYPPFQNKNNLFENDAQEDDEYDEYGGSISRHCYGVCDSVEQLLSVFPELDGDKERKFVVTLSEVRRENQPPEGGWRWHKWGPYIGTQKPKCEYLYDEKGIDSVFCYHIFEDVDYKAMAVDQLKQRCLDKYYGMIYLEKEIEGLDEAQQRTKLIELVKH